MRIGALRHTVTVERPDGAPVRNPDGTFTQAYVAAPPTWPVSIAPVRVEEQAQQGTTLDVGTEVVLGRYRADVDTACRLVHGARVLQVRTVTNVEQRNLALELTVVAVP
jgi:head-tail adaptor